MVGRIGGDDEYMRMVSGGIQGVSAVCLMIND